MEEFETLFRRYYADLYAFLMRLTGWDPALAEELYGAAGLPGPVPVADMADSNCEKLLLSDDAKTAGSPPPPRAAGRTARA